MATVATSADIQAHWEPLIGDVDMGSPDSGLPQGFYNPRSKTVFIIAGHIEAGQEMAVAAHELVHKHGKAVLGEARWRQLHEVIGSWANRPEGSLERQVYDEAAARVQASRPDNADAAAYSSEELFPYAVQVAMELGVQPTALMPNNSVQGWLARVRASLKDVLGKLTGNPQAFDGQDLVDLAFAVAQREGAERAQDTNSRFHEGSQRTGLLFSRALNQYMREAATFGEARAAAKEFQGRPLTNALTGLQAHVSRNSLDKMLSSKAVEKLVSARAQSFAVANLDKLYQAAAYGWSKSDRDANSNIKAIHRFFVPMALNGRLLIAKLTVKETVDENHANPLYTVETVDFNEKSPAAQWVDASAKADGIDLTSIRSAGDVLSLAQEVERRNASGDAAGDATPRFSTRSNGQGPGLSLEQVQQLVQQALSGLRNPPPVDIVGRSEEAWIGAPKGVMGAALPEEGRIVIVASAHLNADAVLETLFHEMFHLGVRNVLPRRDYVQSMLDLAKSDRRVQQYAIEWKAKAPDAPHQLRVLRERGFAGTELTAQYEALAIEEGLAVVAQELRAQKLAGTRLGMRIRKLANWLASVADRMGLGRLAASIRAMSYNEAERFVMRAIDQAGAVGTKTSHTGQTRFSTRSAQDPSTGLQTDDTNDGTQPIHSMRVEMQRDGTLMVQGDPVQLQERLRQGGVDSVLRRERGVLVGLDQVG
ncbi:hypothetical protein HNP48_007076, partial [Acidovorax soli]|nr:hypothetical protein [Acidovorax soli]